MSLRTPQLSDASSLAAISIEVWIGTYLKHGVSGFFADYALSEFIVAKTEALLADPRQAFLVSDNAEGIDGFIRLTTGREAPVAGCPDMEIATFHVQPRHQGEGVGKRLLAGALRHCREAGVRSVRLTTNAQNAPAIAFYLARGFEQVGETRFRIGDEGYLNNVYALRLG